MSLSTDLAQRNLGGTPEQWDGVSQEWKEPELAADRVPLSDEEPEYEDCDDDTDYAYEDLRELDFESDDEDIDCEEADYYGEDDLDDDGDYIEDEGSFL